MATDEKSRANIDTPSSQGGVYDDPGYSPDLSHDEPSAGLDGQHDSTGVHPEQANAERDSPERPYNSSPDEPEKPKKPFGAAALRDQEEAADDPDQPTDDMPGKGPSGWWRRKQAGALRKMITKRRAFMAGAGTTFIFGLGVGVFTSSIPALQAYNYSQILLGTTKHNEHSQNITLGKLYRYMRTGKVGTTRLSYLEYKMYPKMATSLEKTGVKILTERLTGQIRAVSIDPAKLSDLKGMSREEVGKYVADRYGANPAKIQLGSDGGSVRFSMQDLPLKQRELLLKDIVRQSGKGKIDSFLEMRLLRKFYSVPSMFHPIQRSAAKLDAKTLEILRKSKSFRELEKNRTAKIAARSRAANARIASIKTKLLSGAGAATVVLGAQATLCIVYDVAKDADVLNQENFRDPAVKSGADGMAVGEQIAADWPDVTQESVMGYVDNMTNLETKQTPFDAAAIRALQGKTGGVPTNPALKAAFSFSNSATTLVTKLENDFKAGTVCSVGGQIAGGLAGVGLVILGPGGWIIKGITTLGGAAASQVAMTFIQSTVPKLLSEEPPIGIPHQGALGGMFDAYGAREAANEVAMASGGVALSSTTALRREREWRTEERKSWQGQSFFARLFNPKDYRSLAGEVVDSVSPDVAVQTSKTATSLTKLPTLVARIPSTLFTPKASAETTFDWGFPVYAVSDQVLYNPEYADPYVNADKVAALLENSSNSTLTDRAKVCFGVTIAKEPFENAMVWGVRQDTKPNRFSPEYQSANCDQSTSDSWNRISAFVNSSTAMEAEACVLGHEESCGRLGQDSPVGGGVGSPFVTAPTQQPTNLDTSQLTTSSAGIDCYDDQATSAKETRDVGIHDGYVDGIKIPIRICAIPGFKSSSGESNGQYGVTGANGDVLVNSRISRNTLDLFNAAKKDGRTLTAKSSFRTMTHQIELCNDNVSCRSGRDYREVAKPGTSNHQMGLAIDFIGTDVKTKATGCADRATDPGSSVWDWLENNAARFGYRQLAHESWHWDVNPAGTKCGGAGGG